MRLEVKERRGTERERQREEGLGRPVLHRGIDGCPEKTTHALSSSSNCMSRECTYCQRICYCNVPLTYHNFSLIFVTCSHLLYHNFLSFDHYVRILSSLHWTRLSMRAKKEKKLMLQLLLPSFTGLFVIESELLQAAESADSFD